jgi:hypothetical protein
MEILVSDEDGFLLRDFRWRVHANGYVVRSGGRQMVYLHRAITGAGPGQVVDHVNGNPLDNRRDNLRICTRAENMRNRGVQRNNRLGVKGVYINAGRYCAEIRCDGKKISLGRFLTLPEAAQAYAEAASKVHGQFARVQ